MRASAREFVPKELKEFPSLALSSEAALKRAAEKALAANKKQQLSSFKSKAAIVHAPPPPPPSRLVDLNNTLEKEKEVEEESVKDPPAHTPPPPPPPPPPAPLLYESKVKQSAVQRLKETWISIAREARESEQRRRQMASEAAADRERAKRTVSANAANVATGSGWHAYLQPHKEDLWKNSSDWQFPRSIADAREEEEEAEEEEEDEVGRPSPAGGAGQEADYTEELQKAIVSNDVSAAARLLSLAGSRCNVQLTTDGLMQCAKLGRELMLEVLLTRGPALLKAIDVRDRKEKKTALLVAIEHGKLDCARLLIRHGSSLDVKDRAGDTALHLAVRSGNAALVAWLVGTKDRSLKLNARNKRRETPLLVCRTREIASLLLSAGADASAVNCEGWTAQCLAARASNAKLLETLLLSNCSSRREGGDGNLENQQATTCTTPFHQAVLANSLDCLRVVLMAASGPAEVNALDSSSREGMTALQYAACLGRSEAVEMILAASTDLGVDVFVEDSQGASALVLAALHNHRPCVASLAKFNTQSQLHRTNSLGETCLESLVRLLFASSRASLQEHKREGVVQRLMGEQLDVVLDLIVLGFPVTEKFVRRVVPYSCGAFVRDLQCMLDDPASFFSVPPAAPAAHAAVSQATTEGEDKNQQERAMPLCLRFFGPPACVKQEEVADPTPKSYVYSGGGEAHHDAVVVIHDESGGETRLWAHRDILKTCPRFEGMISFVQHQQQQSGEVESLLELAFTVGSDRRAEVEQRALFHTINFIYTGDLLLPSEEDSLDLLMELAWKADEFLLPSMASRVELNLVRRLAHRPLPDEVEALLLMTGTLGGMKTLRAACAFSLLRRNKGGGTPCACRQTVELALRALVEIFDE